MHHAFGFAALVAAIAFAFGERAARYFVALVLVLGAVAFGYVMLRIITGTI